MYKLILKGVVIWYFFPFFDSGSSFFLSFFCFVLFFSVVTTTTYKNIPGKLMAFAFASPGENSGELCWLIF